jgi:hypothetical protein
MFDRLIGKVKEHVEHKIPEPFIIEGVNGEKVTLGIKESKK